MNNFLAQKEYLKDFCSPAYTLLGLWYSLRVKPLGKQTLALIFIVCPSESWGILRVYLDPKEEG